MVRVFARAKSKHGQADALRAVLQKLATASRAEEGVLTYNLFETKEPGEFVFQEEYVSPEDFERHKSSRHLRVAVARATPLMQDELSLWIVDPVC